MHSFETAWWNSCSRFKHCAMHSAIRSPKFNPIGAKIKLAVKEQRQLNRFAEKRQHWPAPVAARWRFLAIGSRRQPPLNYRPQRERADLPQGFRTTNYVRDWLPIRREQCAKRVSRKSGWSRSSARRIASRCQWDQRADDLHMAQAFRGLLGERHQAPEAARGRECAAEEAGCGA